MDAARLCRTAAIVSLLALGAFASSARAVMITVTSTADSGPGTLRAAVAAANAGDRVFLPASTTPYTVSSGEILITKPMTIEGAGAGLSVVTAGGTSRVFHATSSVPNTGFVVFKNLTITGGNVSVAPGGAGVLAEGGNLLFQDAAITGNTVAINATNVSLDGGGGIYNEGKGLTLTNTTVSNNTASITGPGLLPGGAGIYSNGTKITLTDSTVSENTLTTTDTATGGTGGGGILNSGTALLVTGSTIDDNTANVAATSNAGGGGVFDSGSDPVYLNSTISDNTTNAPASTSNGGGGVYTDAVTAWKATNVTIAGNTASASTGGGVFWDGGGELYFKSSIVAGNHAASSRPNCDSTSAPFVSLGYNLTDEAGNSCQFLAPTDIVTANAGLGPLADNGGPTQTRALLAGSPAIDAIPVAACLDQSTPTPQPVATDQRGVPRPEPAGGNCDIGAYEVGPAALGLGATADPVALTVGGLSTLTFTATDANPFIPATAGPAPATHVQLKVTLPAGLSLLASTSSQGSCSAAGAGVTCSLGTINTGASVPVVLVVRAAAVGTPTVAGTVSATETDPTPANETASVTLHVSAVPPVAPVVTHAKQSHRRWRLRRHGAKKSKVPVGTTFSFTLNQAASVKLAFAEKVGGRRGKGRKCVARTKKNAKKHACTLTVKRGTLKVTGHSGANKVTFQGKIPGAKKLRPGTYRVAITATNAAGQSSKAQNLTFTIVK